MGIEDVRVGHFPSCAAWKPRRPTASSIPAGVRSSATPPTTSAGSSLSYSTSRSPTPSTPSGHRLRGRTRIRRREATSAMTISSRTPHVRWNAHNAPQQVFFSSLRGRSLVHQC